MRKSSRRVGGWLTLDLIGTHRELIELGSLINYLIVLIKVP